MSFASQKWFHFKGKMIAISDNMPKMRQQAMCVFPKEKKL
jgi:hypothetical protein